MGPDSPSSYGDTFARVYDTWYGDISNVEATVSTLVGLAAGGPVLELGVGTGRIALPLAAAGVNVFGLDASQAMLTKCRAKPGSRSLPLVCADMAALPLTGRFDLVFVNFNTFFNLTTEETQRACVAQVADLIGGTGSFVVEVFVPSPDPTQLEYRETTRQDNAGGRVLTVSTRDPVAQTVTGVHIHTPAVGAVKRLPWAIRYLHPTQIDDMCRKAGLTLAHRWSDWTKTPAHPESSRHISVYRSAEVHRDVTSSVTG